MAGNLGPHHAKYLITEWPKPGSNLWDIYMLPGFMVLCLFLQFICLFLCLFVCFCFSSHNHIHRVTMSSWRAPTFRHRPRWLEAQNFDVPTVGSSQDRYCIWSTVFSNQRDGTHISSQHLGGWGRRILLRLGMWGQSGQHSQVLFPYPDAATSQAFRHIQPWETSAWHTRNKRRQKVLWRGSCSWRGKNEETGAG